MLCEKKMNWLVSGYFFCTDGTTIPLSYVCDDFADCPYGDDETALAGCKGDWRLRWNPDIFPTGHSPETTTNAYISTYSCQSLGASVKNTDIRIVGFYVKTAIIHQPKRLCVPDYIHGKHVHKFHPCKFVSYFSRADHFILTQELYERDLGAPSVCSEPCGK